MGLFRQNFEFYHHLLALCHSKPVWSLFCDQKSIWKNVGSIGPSILLTMNAEERTPYKLGVATGWVR